MVFARHLSNAIKGEALGHRKEGVRQCARTAILPCFNVHLTYLLFHKPYGVISQFSHSEGERPTLADYVKTPGVYPVGRLDHDSEGLLLLTDNGWLQHRLTDPRYDHPKTYWAQVEGDAQPAALSALANDVQIFPDFRTRPARVRRLDDADVAALPPRDPPVRFRLSVPTSWIELVITEGRNRQVRRMTAAVGHPTLRLIRVAIGPLRLDGLAQGTARELREEELQAIAPHLEPEKPGRRRRRYSTR